MVTASGIVLCGGSSSRMGRAKAWLPWAGRPLLVHVVEQLGHAVDEVIVVAAPEQPLPALGARVVRDREAGLGPLAGLREGLAAARGEIAFATATDAPYLTAAFVRCLLAAGGAAAPVVDGRVQPLSAAYPRAAAEVAVSLLATGHRRLLDLIDALDARLLGAGALPDLDSVRGFNTPDDYLAAVRARYGRGTVTLELSGHARARAGVDSLVRPIGTLAEVLGALAERVALIEDGRVAGAYTISLDDRDVLCDASVPIGPGERVVVADAPAS